MGRIQGRLFNGVFTSFAEQSIDICFVLHGVIEVVVQGGNDAQLIAHFLSQRGA
jgi:hypothetical protein